MIFCREGGGLETEPIASSPERPECLILLDVDELGQHFVGGGDDLGVGLVGSLGDDHLDEFSRQVHIGLFQHGSGNIRHTPFSRLINKRIPGVRGGLEKHRARPF